MLTTGGLLTSYEVSLSAGVPGSLCHLFDTCCGPSGAGTLPLAGIPIPGACPYRKSDPDVLVMQSAEMGLCEDPTDALNFAWNRCVLIQRQMRAGVIVICHVRQRYVPKVPFAKHNDLVEHLPPDRANQPFSIGILPWRSRCRRSVANAHRAKPSDECLSISASRSRTT